MCNLTTGALIDPSLCKFSPGFLYTVKAVTFVVGLVGTGGNALTLLVVLGKSTAFTGKTDVVSG